MFFSLSPLGPNGRAQHPERPPTIRAFLLGQHGPALIRGRIDSEAKAEAEFEFTVVYSFEISEISDFADLINFTEIEIKTAEAAEIAEIAEITEIIEIIKITEIADIICLDAELKYCQY